MRRSTRSPCSVVESARCRRADPDLSPRRGAAGHPALCSRRLLPREDVVVELAPLSASAVTMLAGDGRRRRVRRQPEVTRSTSLSCWPPARLRTCRRPSRTRCSAARRPTRRDGPTTGGACLGRAEPGQDLRARRRAAGLGRGGGGTGAPQLLEVDPCYVRFRHELARNAIRSSVPIAARRRLHAQILEALLAGGRRSGRHRPPRRGGRRRGRGGRVRARCGAAGGGARIATARRTPTTAARSAFVDRRPRHEQAAVLEEQGTAAYLVNRLEEAFETRGAGDRRSIGAFDAEAAVGRCTRVLSRLPLVRRRR